MKVQVQIGLAPNLKSFFTIIISIFVTLVGCSETKDLTTEELVYGPDDEITLPGQSTGSLLTGCYWKRLGGYEKNTIKCRFDGPQGKAIGKNISAKAFFGEQDITESVKVMDPSDYWNLEITIPKDYTSDVKVSAYEDGQFTKSYNVDRVLLTNQGIMSVRPMSKAFVVETDAISNWIKEDLLGIDNNSSSGGIVGVAIDTLIGVGGQGAAALINNLSKEEKVAKVSVSGDELTFHLNHRNSYPPVFCNMEGNNLLVTEDKINEYPNLAKKDENETDYYWDPIKFYKTIGEKVGIPPAVLNNNFFEGAVESVANLVCNELQRAGFKTLEDKCNAMREVNVGAVLDSKGFCLRTYTTYETNQTKKKYYCDVAMFEKKVDDGMFYFMGLGKDRLNEINRDLRANSIEEAVDMYISSFEKCDEFDYKELNSRQ